MKYKLLVVAFISFENRITSITMFIIDLTILYFRMFMHLQEKILILDAKM